MLNFKNFIKGFHLIKENFEFENSEIYTEMIYDALKDKINDKMFLDCCNGILFTTSKQEWCKAYGFKGRPAVKDWLDVFIPKAIEKTRYKICSITGANLKEIYFEYPDHYLMFINQHKQGKLEDSHG
jgi:hypothetical protein